MHKDTRHAIYISRPHRRNTGKSGNASNYNYASRVPPSKVVVLVGNWGDVGAVVW
jgi:hypothetical protein